jgi:hypothetical protein
MKIFNLILKEMLFLKWLFLTFIVLKKTLRRYKKKYKDLKVLKELVMEKNVCLLIPVIK